MAERKQKIGWIGMGRMGYPMAERLLKAGYDVSIWNRTRAKAEPLAERAARSSTSSPISPAAMWSSPSCRPARTSKRSISARTAWCTGATASCRSVFVDCSTIALEESAEIRKRLKELGADFLAAPVSGNAKVIKAGKLSAVASGPEAPSQDRRAADRGVRAAWRFLCRRRRARARLQDRA